MKVTMADRIIDTFLELATEEGRDYRTVGKTDIQKKLQCSPSLINYYYGTIEDLRSLAVYEAGKRGNHRVVISAILHGDVDDLDLEAIDDAIEWLRGSV